MHRLARRSPFTFSDVRRARFVALRLHSVTLAGPQPWTWLYAGVFPAWAVVAFNAVFYGGLLWMAVVFTFSAMRKEEKALWVAFAANGLIAPARVLVPRVSNIVELVQTVLLSTAFLAAVALLVSFWGERARKEPRRTSTSVARLSTHVHDGHDACTQWHDGRGHTMGGVPF